MRDRPPLVVRRATLLRLALAMALLWGVSDTRLQATVVLPADLQDLVEGSELIVRGRVVDVQTDLLGPRRIIGRIVTVSVLDAIKGAPGATAHFQVPGGQIGRYRRVVVGAPEFRPGDEVVVFLRGRAPAMPTIFGVNQGVYRVVRDGAARALVMPVPVVAHGGGAERVVRGDPRRTPLPVHEFTSQVRGLLERRR